MVCRSLYKRFESIWFAGLCCKRLYKRFESIMDDFSSDNFEFIKVDKFKIIRTQLPFVFFFHPKKAVYECTVRDLEQTQGTRRSLRRQLLPRRPAITAASITGGGEHDRVSPKTQSRA